MIHVHRPLPGRAPKLALAALIASVVGAATVLTPIASAAGRAPAASYHHVGQRTQLAWSRWNTEGTAIGIVLYRPESGSVRKLTDPEDDLFDLDPQISPDGRWVLFQRETADGAVDQGLVRVDGTGERILDLGCTDPCVDDVAATWAPDGRHLIFSRVTGPLNPANNSFASVVLVTSDLHGRHVTRISQPGIDGVYEDYGASFSGSGTMYFLRIRNPESPDGPVNKAVFRMTRDGRVQRLTPWSLNADYVSVSPARRGPTRERVVFETGATDDRGEAVATVDGRCRSYAACVASIRYLTSPTARPVENDNPAWSPAGDRIAYVRIQDLGDQGALADIWQMSWDGTHKQPISEDPAFELRPTWGRAPARH